MEKTQLKDDDETTISELVKRTDVLEESIALLVKSQTTTNQLLKQQQETVEQLINHVSLIIELIKKRKPHQP